MKNCKCQIRCCCQEQAASDPVHGDGSTTANRLALQNFIKETSSFSKKSFAQETLITKDPQEKNGKYAHQEGYLTKAKGFSSHGEGNKTEAIGAYSHAEGEQTKAYGEASHAEGVGTIVRGDGGHAEGAYAQSNGLCSHAEGSYTQSNGHYSHAEGFHAQANGFASHAAGNFTIAANDYSTALGRYNSSAPEDAFIIGNGTDQVRSNAFGITFAGETSAASFHGNGADFAQMFEWEDGNVFREDRIGCFVTLDHGKIRLAQPSEYILGVTSESSSHVGNSEALNWQGMYLKDPWRRPLFDMQGMTLINPAYDSSKSYVPRHLRPEWAAVGMVGQLLVQDDGTCQVNGFCQCGENGVATASEAGYFVMERLSESHVSIILK